MCDAFERSIMLRLETMQVSFSDSVRRVVDLLEAKHTQQSEDIDDMLQEPCQTIKDLGNVCLQISTDSSFKKRMESAVTF